MLDKDDILNSISLTGAASSENQTVNHLLSRNLNHILNIGSGLPRLNSNIINRFNLIISQPSALISLNSLSIRCSICHRVIRYPAWYYSIQHNVNVFHYFVCFDGRSSTKPNTACMRRI